MALSTRRHAHVTCHMGVSISPQKTWFCSRWKYDENFPVSAGSLRLCFMSISIFIFAVSNPRLGHTGLSHLRLLLTFFFLSQSFHREALWTIFVAATQTHIYSVRSMTTQMLAAELTGPGSSRLCLHDQYDIISSYLRHFGNSKFVHRVTRTSTWSDHQTRPRATRCSTWTRVS